MKEQEKKRKVSAVDDYDDDDFEPDAEPPDSEDSDWQYGGSKKNKKTSKRKPRKSTKGKN